ncbi:hypothetical protein HID58_092273 [Brassica napus]|uniref:Uncharacterized protein n=1 Tax=Brassica napus TaxID=3708 RepID=A0ABQ7WXH3_BRANA|nr:hypothetical protein HID58_092273 [Brassica napus]
MIPMSTSSGSQLFKCAHVELIAAYESDEAVFGGFDGKMTKLTNIRATEVGHLLVLKTLKTVSSLCTLLTLWQELHVPAYVVPLQLYFHTSDIRHYYLFLSNLGNLKRREDFLLHAVDATKLSYITSSS